MKNKIIIKIIITVSLSLCLFSVIILNPLLSATSDQLLLRLIIKCCTYYVRDIEVVDIETPWLCAPKPIHPVDFSRLEIQAQELMSTETSTGETNGEFQERLEQFMQDNNLESGTKFQERLDQFIQNNLENKPTFDSSELLNKISEEQQQTVIDSPLMKEFYQLENEKFMVPANQKWWAKEKKLDSDDERELSIMGDISDSEIDMSARSDSPTEDLSIVDNMSDISGCVIPFLILMSYQNHHTKLNKLLSKWNKLISTPIILNRKIYIKTLKLFGFILLTLSTFIIKLFYPILNFFDISLINWDILYDYISIKTPNLFYFQSEIEFEYIDQITNHDYTNNVFDKYESIIPMMFIVTFDSIFKYFNKLKNKSNIFMNTPIIIYNLKGGNTSKIKKLIKIISMFVLLTVLLLIFLYITPIYINWKDLFNITNMWDTLYSYLNDLLNSTKVTDNTNNIVNLENNSTYELGNNTSINDKLTNTDTPFYKTKTFWLITVSISLLGIISLCNIPTGVSLDGNNLSLWEVINNVRTENDNIERLIIEQDSFIELLEEVLEDWKKR